MESDSPKEHPIVEVLRKDREKEDTQATAVVKDYHTTITYLGAGALGFFLTIHEKFFQLQDGRFLWLFVISLALLFLSLLLFLISILLEYYSHSDLRDTMDHYITTVDFENTSQVENDAAEAALIAKWKKSENTSKKLMFLRLGLVIVGIAAEIGFIALNISTAKLEQAKTPEIRISLPIHKDSFSIMIDTSATSNIKIKFQNP